jgi:cytochrome c553
VAAGKKIYEEGIPNSDVPPCAGCHGSQAKGDGALPRLAGQLNDYIAKKLANGDKELGKDQKKPDISAIMQPIAHSLTESQIAAVAAYLSYLNGRVTTGSSGVHSAGLHAGAGVRAELNRIGSRHARNAPPVRESQVRGAAIVVRL